MRSLNTLYLLLWERIKDMEVIHGLCFEMSGLGREKTISQDEFDFLFRHFKSQKPDLLTHKEFFNNNRYEGSLWWWSTEEDKDPINRKAFIKKMIEITK